MFRKFETFEIWAMFTLEGPQLLRAEPMRRTDLTSTLIMYIHYLLKLKFGKYVLQVAGSIK